MRWIYLSAFRSIDGSVQKYRVDREDESPSLTVSTAAEPDAKYEIAYTRTDDGRLVFHASLKNDTIVATVRRVDESKFVLVSRGFHWINETPFNN